jgi:anti-sigma regulatory factor (Ser/Thr protein kinase)
VSNVAETEARTFDADPQSLADVRVFLRERAEHAGVSDRTRDDLLLAATEAAANAILHSGTRSLEVVWSASAEAVTIEVRDQGTYRRRVRVPSVEGPGGFGIPLMAALTDELEIREGTPRRPGTSVKLVKRRSSS